MPRGEKQSISSLSLDELRRLIAKREHVLQRLQIREQSLAKELAAVRHQIAAIAGRKASVSVSFPLVADERPKRRGRRGRGVGGQTVADALVEIIQRNGQPMRVGEMAEAFRKLDHPTRSKNLNKLIAVTIKGSKRFKRVARGLYTVK